MIEKISLIIPCKNEVESLGAVLEEVKDNKFGIFMSLIKYIGKRTRSKI